jgi:hypothetical protein
METRQELEERLETVLNDILSEVQARKGEVFDGNLEDALSFLKEAQTILNQLNDDNYEEDEEETDLGWDEEEDY